MVTYLLDQPLLLAGQLVYRGARLSDHLVRVSALQLLRGQLRLSRGDLVLQARRLTC